MQINELREEQNLTIYKLAKESGVPYATVNDICNEKVSLRKCSAETLYKLAKTLGVPMEDIIESAMDDRTGFDTFKSNVCHMVKDLGDFDFIAELLSSDKIREYWEKKWYPECFYLLAMLDYLSGENELPLCTKYNDIRKAKLEKIIYPLSIITLCIATKNDKYKIDSFRKAIPEFKKFNIVENEVRNVI